MATAGFPHPYPAVAPPACQSQAAAPSNAPVAFVPAVRRRATREQGRALEILGHAIEYLIDSRMFLVEEPTTPGDQESTRILMQASRNVFAECAELLPITGRIRRWMQGGISSRAQ